jgi:flagellin
MAVTFNTNLSALTSQRYLGIAADKAASSLGKLSSGSRVPSAKDDAAALAVGSKLKAEVVALAQASNNASQASSLLQIADGALSTVGDILQRMKALATQSSSGQLGNAERSLLNQEFTNLRTEVDRIANVTNFNGTTLLNGSTNQIVSDVNNLTTSGDALSAESLISQGVQSVSFASGFTRGGVKLEFDATSNLLKMTNLVSGQVEAVDINNTAITTGSTQTVNFNTLGATVILNSSFDKSVSSSITNGYRSMDNFAIGGAQAGSVTTGTISEFRLKETSGISTNNFNTTARGGNMTTVITVTSAGTNGAASTATATVSGRTFTQVGTVDLSTAGAKTMTLADADGNEFDIAFTTNAAITTGNFTLTPGRIVGVNTVRADIPSSDLNLTGGVITGQATFSNLEISSTSFVGTNPPLNSDLNGLTIATTEAAGIVTFGAVTVGDRTFTASGTLNLTDVADNYIVFNDGNGNSFTLRANLSAADAGTDDTMTDIAIALDGGQTVPAVQANSLKLIGINRGSASTFDFGTIADATITGYTNGSTSDTSIDAVNNTTLILNVGNGNSFTATGVDLSTAGMKTITLTRGTGTAQDSITVQFNVTTAMANADSLSMELGELGQLIAANQVSGTSTAFSFKVGTGVTSNDSIAISLNAATTSTLGISGSTVDTANNADAAIGLLNIAINTISSNRASVGAAQSRLDFASNSISVAIENFTAATSALMDVDVSAEITEFTSQNVLMQAGISLLAQANQQPSLLLRLLQ